jgi:hypothetical protein
VIEGIPAASGTFDLTATANNRNGTGTLAFQITIAELTLDARGQRYLRFPGDCAGRT